MPDAASYSAIETLRDGRRVEIRALRPEDQAAMLAAVDRSSSQSLYRRFFGPKRVFSKKEVAFFLNIDFANHVALVTVAEEKGRAVIVAGGRYVVERSRVAEIAFVVVDEYQKRGIGAVLLRHLAIIARSVGINEFIAEVLPENKPMLKVFERSGFKINTRRGSGAIHVALQLS
jgi:RimJ/RimL family protein N-acetyltransferase